MPKMREEMGEDMKLYSIGRISPVKDLETQIRAIKQLKINKVIPEPIILEIYGEVITEIDKKYKLELEQLIEELQLEDSVFFKGAKKHCNIT